MVTQAGNVAYFERAFATPNRIARLVEPISPATAGALLSYAHVPDLF